jgi:uncharacterized protein YkwD
MSIENKSLFLIFIFLFLGVSTICAQHQYDKYYTNVEATAFLSDTLLDKCVEGAFINLDLLNAAIFHLTNVERFKADLISFDFYKPLYLSASIHSECMIKYDFFDHINKQERQWRTPSDRILYFESSYISLAENIVENNMLDYKGDLFSYRLGFDQNGNSIYFDVDGNEILYSTYRSLANRLVTQWINSKPHRENILNGGYRLLACSCAIDEKKNPIVIRCTQNFGSLE